MKPRHLLFGILLIAIFPLCVAAQETATAPKAVTPEVQTAEWAKSWWMPRHEQKLADMKKQGTVDLLMIGDSITHSWENGGKEVWNRYYAKRNAFNIGFSGDRTEHVLWRLAHGAVDGISPKLAVIMIGTNNTGHRQDPPEETTAGVRAIVEDLQRRLPKTKILLLAIFPRSARPDDKLRKLNDAINQRIAKLADGKHVFYLDINRKFLNDDGTLPKSIMPDLLHPNAQGYAIWAEAMEPMIRRLMGEELVLADGGRSAYRIVVADDASPSTKHGAEELKRFLNEITGAELPIVSDREPPVEREITLGNNAHLKQLDTQIDFDALGPEGYVIRTVGNHLVIAGGELRGNMYGVYGLLEDHLGCRWFTPDVSRIPKHRRLAVGPLDDRQVPVLEYREPFTFDCYDGDWCARNRVNSSAGRLEAKHGGKIKFAGGFFCHTFNRLVPPEKYFDEHPEYFSLVGGKRLKTRSQLCCTNEDVIRLCTEGIRAAMAAQDDAFAFSVSQNDWHNYCQCDTCQALAKREESQMAPVLHLVNRVAAAVEKEFPDKVVETLAYQWTRKAPKTMRPRPNVVVRLCSIECCFSHSLAECDSEANRMFRQDAAAWAKVGNRLWVWDYVTDFRHYLLPFPNQRIRNDNIRFFIRHNVKGIFEQDTYHSADSEMVQLGGYLTAKFLWNPDYDEATAMGEFLAAYYGKAAEPIRAYLDLLHDRVAQQNIHVVIWAGPESPHLTDELLIRAERLWQRAEAAVAGQPEVLERVRRSRMSVDYAVLERARLQVQGRLPANKALKDVALVRFEPFFEVLNKSKLSHLRESAALDKAEYRQTLAKTLQFDKSILGTLHDALRKESE